MAAIACIFRALFLYIVVPCIVMVVCSGADCHSKKTRPGANIFFFPSPYSVFLWYKEFHGTIQFGISFLRPPQYTCVPYIGLKNLPKSYSQLVNAISQQQWTVSNTRALCSMFAIGERGHLNFGGLEVGKSFKKDWKVPKSIKTPKIVEVFLF